MKNQLHEYFGASVTNEEMEEIIETCLKEQDEENKKTLHNSLPRDAQLNTPQNTTNAGDLFSFNQEPSQNQGQSVQASVTAVINNLYQTNPLLSPYSNYQLFANNYNNNPLSSTSTSSIFSPGSGILSFSGISPNIKNDSLFNTSNNNNNISNDILSSTTTTNNNNNQILSAPSSTINSGGSMNSIILDSSCTSSTPTAPSSTTSTETSGNTITSSSTTSPPPLLQTTPSLSKSDIFTLSTSTPLPSLTSLDNTLTNTEQSNVSTQSTNSIPPQLVGLEVASSGTFNNISEPTFTTLSLTSPGFNMLSPPSPFENYNNPKKRAKIEIPTPTPYINNSILNNNNVYNNNNNNSIMSPNLLTPTGIEPYSIYSEENEKKLHAVPYENKITYTILTMLDCTDIHNFGLTCKDNYQFVQQDSIWEYMVKSRYKRSSKWHFNGNWEKLYHQITGRCNNPYPIPKCLYGCTFVFNNCSSTEYEMMIIKLGGTISKSDTMLMDNNITQKFVLVSDKSFQPYANMYIYIFCYLHLNRMPTESPGTPIYFTFPQFKALVNSRYSKFLQM